MKIKTIFLLFVLLAVSGLSINPAQAAPAADPNSLTAAAAGWQKITIDTGSLPSLAINPVTQQPYISYAGVNGIKSKLKLAFPVSTGGDCGPSNAWSCNSLPYQSHDLGLGSSLAFNSAGQWAISYYWNAPDTALGIQGPTVNSDFNYYPIDFGDILYSPTSMAFSASGNLAVAYVVKNSTNPSAPFLLKYASYAGSFGTCPDTFHDWNCETITTVQPNGIVPPAPSLTFVNDLPIIAYSATPYSRLYTAIYNGGSSGSCPLNTKWNCPIVNKDSVVTGMPSLKAFSRTDIALAYYDDGLTSSYLVVASGTAGNCVLWNCMFVEKVGAKAGDVANTSIAMYNGHYIVAYTDRRNGKSILKVAYPDPTGHGTCDTTDPVVLNGWRCTVIDDGGGTQLVGQFVSIGVTNAGSIYLAYSNETAHTIQLAYLLAVQPNQPRYTYLPAIRR